MAESDAHGDRRHKELRSALVELKSGDSGVHVSLQYEQTLKGGSRTERRQLLVDQFGQLAFAVGIEEIDFESISVSAQTIEAAIPLENYDNLITALGELGFRVDPVIEIQILPDEEQP